MYVGFTVTVVREGWLKYSSLKLIGLDAVSVDIFYVVCLWVG